MIHRAKTVKTNRECFGHAFPAEGKWYMILEDAEIGEFSHAWKYIHEDCFVEIDPSTLAMDTTVKAKNGEPIFGSIPVDGAMSDGGDEVNGISIGEPDEQGKVEFRNGCFGIDRGWKLSAYKFLEIIPPACEGDK